MKDRTFNIAKNLLFSLFLFSFSYNLLAQSTKITYIDSDSLILEFNLPDLKVERRSIYGQNFDLIKFDDASYIKHKGLPIIPFVAKTIGIPPGALPNITILVDEQASDGAYRLLPYQQNSLPSQKADQLMIDSDFYSQNQFYPEKALELQPLGYIREQRIGRLKIHPIQYNPAKRQIKIHKHIVVKLEFNIGKTERTNQNRMLRYQESTDRPEFNIGNTQSGISERRKPFEQLFKTSLINYQQAIEFREQASTSNLEQFVSSGPVQITSSDSYKITVTETGLYKVTYSRLKNAGAELTDINANTFKMFCEGREVSIYIYGGEDGTFDGGDYIIFFGEAIINSKFTEKNVYILSWGGTKGLRPATVSGEPEITSEEQKIVSPIAFKTTEHLELDRLHNPLENVKSELVDHFFWTGFTGGTNRGSHDFPVSMPYAAKDLEEEAVLRLKFQGISYEQNEKHVALVKFNLIPLDIFKWRGQENPNFETQMPQKYISPDSQNWLTIESHDTNNTPEGEIDFCLDWFELDYWRTFKVHLGRLEFSSIVAYEESDFIPTDTITYEITNFSNPEIEFFELGDNGLIAKIVNGKIEEEEGKYKITVRTHPTVPTKYYVTQKSSYRSPQKVEKYSLPGLRNPNNQADYIIISHKDFIDTVDRLAEFRRETGLSVKIVNVEDIYNEFSNGIFNPMAIKSFLRYAYINWSLPKPSYVLLVGDGHWDYKNATVKYYREALGIEKNIPPIYVPTYHGWSPEGGETAMDQKFVEVSGDDSLPDMLIGRLPVQTSSELNDVIDKIINYEQNAEMGAWQSRIMQIADNDTDNAGDEKFQITREALVRDVIPPSIETREVYLKDIVSASTTKRMIIENMRDGVIALEYSGHGGANSWAHEGIFMIEDIQTLKNKHLPFAITTTCLNGIFDKPMEAGYRCISEEFLLVPKHGAVANLSASRLTYADANAAFDRDLFKNMFKIKPAFVGAIINAAKIDFIANQTELWWPNIQQYTLLGDPATVLTLPQLEVEVEIKEKSLDPSKKIVITPNIVGKKRNSDAQENDEFTQIIKSEDFNSDLLLTVVYPNNFDNIPENDFPIFQKTFPIWNGEYGEISIDIPDNVVPGKGIVRMFATDGKRSAIGGVKFSVYNPVIIENISKFSEDESFLLIYVAIDDNKGISGIQDVSCEWKNTVNFKTVVTKMVSTEKPVDINSSVSSNAIWYRLSQPIPLPKGGKLIKYTVFVTDDESNIVRSEQHSVEAPIGANITVSHYPDSGSPMIDYKYSNLHQNWTLNVQLENNGGKDMLSPIWVYFFDGNPDLNANNIIDEEDIQPLGRIRLPADSWEQNKSFPEDGVRETALVSLVLDKALNSGYHKVYVWADPELPDYDHEDDIEGEVAEPYSYDNKISYLFLINDFVLMDEDLTTYSLDNILKAFFPKGAAEPTTISISSIPLVIKSDTNEIVGDSLVFEQPNILPALIPGENQYEAFSIEFSSGVKELKKNADVNIKFDMFKLKDKVIEKTGIRYGTQLQAQMLKEAEKLSIYSWMPDIKMWKRLNSQLITNEITNEEGSTKQLVVEKYIGPAHSENHSDQRISSKYIKLDPDITPIGEWVILFLDSKNYEVMLDRNDTANNYSLLERKGKVGETYKDEIVGIEINIPDPTNTEDNEDAGKEFEFGDIFYFRTYFDPYYSSTRAQEIRNYNYGDGNVHIRIQSDETDKRDFGRWLIFFNNSEEYEIRDEDNKPLQYSYGSNIYGKVNKPSYIPPLELEINVNAGERSFKFGDKFKFDITEVGMVKAELNKLSTVTLMYNNDTISPKVNIWVNGQEAQPASVIPPRPEISVLISDSNGIDIDTLSFQISKNDGEFQDVPKDDYVMNNQVTTTTIRYTPILYIGKYFYRISVNDLNGNGIKIDGKDYLEYLFFVEEQPDLTPPSISVEAIRVESMNTTQLQNGGILTEPSIFRINITDEHGIVPDSLMFSFEPENADYLWNFTDEDYDFEFDGKNPTEATITYKPDLSNGKYQIQLKVIDTSKNVGKLQLEFSMDESVKLSNLLNVPNPFKRETVFVYELTQIPDNITIKIYTLTGRLIKTIEMNSCNRHYNEQYWDGRDENGKRLANGTYFYKFILETEGKKIIKTGKIVVLR